MQTIPTALSGLIEHISPAGATKGSGLSKSIDRTLNERSKMQLAEILSQICALQKNYGKTQTELETLVEGFSWALAGYSMRQIIPAMRKYVLNNSDIPSPSDIIRIIEKPNEPEVLEFSLERLQTFAAKGIPLTPEQREKLDRLVGKTGN